MTAGYGVEMVIGGGADIQSDTIVATGVTPSTAPRKAPAAIRWSSIVGWWLAHGLLIASAIMVPFPIAHGSGLHVGSALARWGVWQDDAVNYARVAFQGYTASPAWPAYWPGIPLLIALTRSPWVTLAVIQAALLAVMRLMATAAMDLGLSASAALAAVALFALNPAAVYYSSAYPELWVVGGFLIAIRATVHRRPWPMAAGIAAATIMDPLGAVVCLLPLLLAIQAWRRRDARALQVGLAGVAAGAAVVVGFCGYLAAMVGNPLAMVSAQRYWHGAWTLPWVQVAQEAQRLLVGVSQTNRGVALVVVILTVPSLYVGIRWMASGGHPASGPAAVTSVAMALLSLAFQAEGEPLLSTARFLSMLVPGYFGMARCKGVSGPVLVLTGFSAMVGAVAFTHGHFWW